MVLIEYCNNLSFLAFLEDRRIEAIVPGALNCYTYEAVNPVSPLGSGGAPVKRGRPNL